MTDLSQIKELLIEYADHLGAKRDRKAGRDMYTCPLCHSGEHGTGSTGAMHIGYNKNGTLSYYCHSCGSGGNIIDMYCQHQGISNTRDNFSSVIKGLKSELGIPNDDYRTFKKNYQYHNPIEQSDLNPTTTVEQKDRTKFFNMALQNQSQAIDYLKTRAIVHAESIARYFQLGYTDSFAYQWENNQPSKTTPAVIIPTSNYSYAWRSTTENIKKKSGATVPLNIGCLNNPSIKWVFLVEGEFDLFSTLDITDDVPNCEFSAISVNSAGNLSRFIDSYIANAIQEGTGLIIALDNDPIPNEQVEKHKANGLKTAKKHGIPCVVADVKALYLGTKDANESLKKDRQAFTDALLNEVEKAKKLDIEAYKKECEKLKEEQHKTLEEPQRELAVKECCGKEVPPYIKKKDKGEHYVYTLQVEMLADTIRREHPFLLVTYANDRNAKPDFYLYQNGVYRLKSLDTLKAFIKSNYLEPYKNLNANFIENKHLVKICESLYTDYYKFVDSSQLDQNENIINFSNGLLHLDTMILEPHSPTVYSTIQLPCEYNPDSTNAPVFTSYMNTLTNGNNNVARVILEFLGISISNIKGYRMKKALFTVGKGDSGKSQIRLLANKLLGFENTSGIDLDTLEERFGTSAIYRKRVIGSADMGFLNVKQLRTFKQITGGDSINCEFKGGAFFSFIYGGVVWFSANEMPKFGGDKGEWVYDRMIIVRCDNTIPKEKQDKTILEKMFAEREAIINMLIPHIKDVINNGYEYTIPEECVASREEYKKENSLVKTFLDECTEPRTQFDGCTCTKTYTVFKAWCDDNARYRPTNQEFRKELASIFGVDNAKNLEKKDSHGIRYYKLFTLTLDTRKDYVKAYGYDSVDNTERCNPPDNK